MTLDPDQIESFEEAVRPLVKWLCDNCHPHVTVIVTPTDAELVEGVTAVRVYDYVKD